MQKISKIGNCIRNASNYSKQRTTDKIDKPSFDLIKFTKDMSVTTPKLVEMIKTINLLDEADMKNHGKLFKHFIYTDVKNSAAGAKMIAAGLMSNGFANIYDKSLKIDNTELVNNINKNFALLCSVQIYNKPFPLKLRKEILEIYNRRPDNIKGELIRFIILDQGFKEGIDLFDVKYVHLFEPLLTASDEKQAIGRGTRYCGQKGLNFDNEVGWALHVFKYEIIFNDKLQLKYDEKTAFDLFIKNSGLDIKKLLFANELENISRYGAVDYELNKNVHDYGNNIQANKIYIPSENSLNTIIGIPYEITVRSLNLLENSRVNIYTQYRLNKTNDFALSKKVKNPLEIKGGGIKGKKKKGQNIFLEKAPQKMKDFVKMREYIKERFMKYKWVDINFENKCLDEKSENEDLSKKRLIKFTPTQEFVTKYFDNSSASKGLLLWHSVGTGKTCSAISIASSGFEKHNYTILWVTRFTLKADIWKNMFNSVCSSILRKKIEKGEFVPSGIVKGPLRYLSKNWLMPISYKQFSNMLLEKNNLFKIMQKRNGKEDPLRKTLVIIDEGHKLYSSDLPISERPNINILKEKVKHSYKISGKDSVRLLIMTATPYTSNPMDLIKLINLMKENGEELPEDFEEFSNKYLDDKSNFTDKGAEDYLNNISGYISYLNRERDVRQFAYPVFYNVIIPLSQRNIEKMEELQLNNEKIKLEIINLENKIKDKLLNKEDKKSAKDILKTLKTNYKNDKKLITKEQKDNKKFNMSQEDVFDLCLKKI